MIAGDIREVVHGEPVWRERSNFIISGELPEKDRPCWYEQLFVRRVGDDRFGCTPFAFHDIALGDIVVTAPKGDRKYAVR